MKPTHSPLAKTLTVTAASTSALFALQHHTDAAVIYSGAQNLTITIPNTMGSHNAALPLNLDGVGGNDVLLQLHFVHIQSATTFGTFTIGPGALVGASVGSRGGGAVIATANNLGFIKRLASGAVISQGNIADGGAATIRNIGTSGNGIGTWGIGQTGFAGIRFPNGANRHFAWVRLKFEDTDAVNPYPDKLTVFDWAYESTPGAAINAGQTTSVPEPTSTALLALAGAGAAALRRRRGTR